MSAPSTYLVKGARLLDGDPTDLLLRDVTPRIRRLLEITGLDRSFRFGPDGRPPA